MNRVEQKLVGVFLKNFIRSMCRNRPYDDELFSSPYPYPAKQMKARKGARFTVAHISGYEIAGEFMMRFDKLIKPIGRVMNGLPDGAEMLVDSADLPNLVGGYGSFPEDTVCKLFSSYFSTMNQNGNWPHLSGCYEELMKAASDAGYAERRKLDAATVKQWAELAQEAFGNEKEMYDLFDRKHGTTDGVIWMWSSKMNRLLDAYSMHVDPTLTGGPYE